MSRQADTELYYRFACSSFLVSGTVETVTDWLSTEAVPVPTANVSLYVEADVRRPIIILPRMEGSHDLSLKLMSDGRLAAVSGTTRGLLADLLEASLGIASFAAGLVGAAIAPRLPSLPAVAPPATTSGVRALTVKVVSSDEKAGKKTPEEQWGEENPDGDAERLKKARETIAQLHDALIAACGDAATSELPATAYRRLLLLKAAIAAVEDEIRAINLRRDAWFNGHGFRVVEEHRFHLACDEVFRLHGDHSVAPPTIKRSELEHGVDAARAALDRLYLAVVELRSSAADPGMTAGDADDLTQFEQDDEVGELPPGVHFRIPRPATIALYQDAFDRNPGDDDRTLTLHSVDRYWVVDLDSRIGSVPLTGEGKLEASATFAPTGAVETVSLDVHSTLEQVVGALGRAPATIGGGLGQAKTAVETWGTLRAARADRELHVLEQRKQQLETDIARRGLAADAAHGETLQELKDRLERLKTEKDIGTVQTPAPPDPQATQDDAERKLAARLRTELAIARAQQELARFPEPAADRRPH